ncbi:MAG: CRISPR-associated protein Cas4 [Thermoplasmata archaeon]
MTLSVAILLTLAAAALVVLGRSIAALRSLAHARRHGRLESVDVQPGPVLRSARYRLVGRPDELRRRPDGRPVPVELKSRRAPAGGPPPSHVVQVWAYCLLLEDVTGIAPPYGVVRYGDGTEFRIEWTAEARRELLRWREAVDRPYDGRATPSPARCRRCPWAVACDARAS